MKKPLCFITFTVLSLLLLACSQLGYYSQSISGHLTIMSARRPIEEMLSDPNVAAELKEKLVRAVAYRRYATESLYLPENDSYLSYADTGRSAALWNIVAAPDDSLVPKQWCFVIAGCLPYRGYYDQTEANVYAGRLTAEGYDVKIYAVPAYSTLGWFDDPLLNTVIDLPEWGLAGIIFHELAHQLVYVQDDAIFNEAFAQMVEEEGVRRWLAAYGTDEIRATFQRSETRQAGFRALLQQTRGALAACYATDREHAARIACKEEVLDRMQLQYAELKESWGGYAGYDGWFRSRPNNASFVSAQTYRHYLPAFERVLQEQNGDLKLFYAEVKRLAALSFQERKEVMDRLLTRDDEPF